MSDKSDSSWNIHLKPYLELAAKEKCGHISEPLISDFPSLSPIQQQMIENALIGALRDENKERATSAVVIVKDLYEYGAPTPTFHHSVAHEFEEMIFHNEIDLSGSLAYKQIISLVKFKVDGAVPFIKKRISQLEVKWKAGYLNNREYKGQLWISLVSLIEIDVEEAIQFYPCAFFYDRSRCKLSELGMAGRLLSVCWNKVGFHYFGKILEGINYFTKDEKHQIYEKFEKVVVRMFNEVSRGIRKGFDSSDGNKILGIAREKLGISN